MESVTSVVNSLLLLSLGGCGIYFFSVGGWRLVCCPKLLFARAEKNGSAVPKTSPFSALCVALGGTIGVGNTIGVASAICLGGAGSVFWMWISAAFGMALKYAEVYLAHRFQDRKVGLGGAMILLKKAGKKGLSKLFALSCVLVSFGMGNLAQSGAAAYALEDTLGLRRHVCGMLLTLFCIFIFLGGFKRLTSFSTIVVPLASGLFFLLCAGTLYRNRIHLPEAVLSVFRDAFSFRALGGGFLASLFCRSLLIGFSRGIFSNEAGLGSAPLVHAEADNTAENQALWGAREVFLDTHIVCTLSALCLLSSPVYLNGAKNPATLCTEVFSDALGKFGSTLFALSLFLFAIASILAWGFYGRRGVEFLTSKKRSLTLYYCVFFALTFLGALFRLDFILSLSDLFNLCMALPNLYALWKYRRKISFPKKQKEHCLQFVHKSFLSYGKICSDEGE